MDNKELKHKIEHNFSQIDCVLQMQTKDEFVYKTIFGIRMVYCVYSELVRYRNLYNWKYKFIYILKSLVRIITFPFFKYKVKNNNEIVILGNTHLDQMLSSEINAPTLIIKKQYGIYLDSMYILLKIITIWIFLLFNKGLNTEKTFMSLSDILKFWKYYYIKGLHGLKIIITADDVYPQNVAIIYAAKKLNISSIRIEYFNINSIMFNNVFCNYYFYPSTIHLNIRELSLYNNTLKYIKGGFLRADYIPNKNYSIDKSSKWILYFTAHSNPFSFDDTYYISQILKYMTATDMLCIKIHPNERNKRKYDYLSKYENVKVVNDENNIDLISNSKMCFSQISLASLEAKQIGCIQSYFINYEANDCIYSYDYSCISNFFDVIKEEDTLKHVFDGTYNPISKEVFSKNFNLTYPNTFQVFKDTLSKILVNP